MTDEAAMTPATTGDEILALRRRVEELERENAELRADKVRLDWLETWLRWKPNTPRELWSGHAGFACVEEFPNPGPSFRRLRAAIDAARDDADD